MFQFEIIRFGENLNLCVCVVTTIHIGRQRIELRIEQCELFICVGHQSIDFKLEKRNN